MVLRIMCLLVVADKKDKEVLWWYTTFSWKGKGDTKCPNVNPRIYICIRRQVGEGTSKGIQTKITLGPMWKPGDHKNSKGDLETGNGFDEELSVKACKMDEILTSKSGVQILVSTCKGLLAGLKPSFKRQLFLTLTDWSTILWCIAIRHKI